MATLDPRIPRRISPESLAPAASLEIWADDQWTINTEVRYIIWPIRGRWHVYVLFCGLEPPLKMLIRRLDHYPSRARAETFARIFQRGIRKDARGTQKRKQHAYHICPN